MVPWEVCREMKYIGLSSQMNWNPWIPSLPSIWHPEHNICEQWRDPDTQNPHADCARARDAPAGNQSTEPVLSQSGKQGINTLLLNSSQAPQWMSALTAPITTLTAPQTRLYWESPGNLPVLDHAMPQEQLRPVIPSPLGDRLRTPHPRDIFQQIGKIHSH